MDTGNKVLIQCNPHDKKWSNGLRMTDKDAADPTKRKGENKPRYYPLCNQRQ